MISDRFDRLLSKRLENLTRIDLSFLLRMSEMVEALEHCLTEPPAEA